MQAMLPRIDSAAFLRLSNKCLGTACMNASVREGRLRFRPDSTGSAPADTAVARHLRVHLEVYLETEVHFWLGGPECVSFAVLADRETCARSDASAAAGRR